MLEDQIHSHRVCPWLRSPLIVCSELYIIASGQLSLFHVHGVEHLTGLKLYAKWQDIVAGCGLEIPKECIENISLGPTAPSQIVQLD